MSIPSSSSYVCDTIPAAKLAVEQPEEQFRPRSPSPPVAFRIPSEQMSDGQISRRHAKEQITCDVAASDDDAEMAQAIESAPPQSPPRKLCVRHQRMADEGTNLKLQKSLDALPVEEREAVNAIWSNFSSSSHPRRELILRGLLTMCCFSQLSLLTEQLAQLIRIDPFVIFPREVSLKVLGYLDATSLCRAAQVSKHWRGLADDDILWRGICEQHIGQKCLKCGWGLPVLERRRAFRTQASPAPTSPASTSKRDLEDGDLSERPLKRQRSEVSLSYPEHVQAYPGSISLSTPSTSGLASDSPSNVLLIPNSPPPQPETETVTRPWKDVYSERLTVERNWRRGRCTVRTLKGHTDGVMCLQFSETLSHPSFPILMTGSYDRTVRIWNLETGLEVRCLRGHTRAVRALQFDAAKLITGSMDHTIRVWNWRSGVCIKTLEGHSAGVVCLNFDGNVLASGSVDSTVKVWNFRTGEAFTLRGHRDWINSVQLWDSGRGKAQEAAGSYSSSSTSWSSPLSSSSATVTPLLEHSGPDAPDIDPGKMLFSASDDGTIRLWDLISRSCVRQFTGHVGQVQSIKLLVVDEEDCHEETAENAGEGLSVPALSLLSSLSPVGRSSGDSTTRDVSCRPGQNIRDQLSRVGRSDSPSSNYAPSRSPSLPKTLLISGSLDNTIKVWDVSDAAQPGTDGGANPGGKAAKTLFGHIEGVWAVTSDKLRLVSASHDRTIKVWNHEEGKCTATLVGHCGAVTCLGLGDDKIVSGGDDGDVRVWSFGG